MTTGCSLVDHSKFVYILMVCITIQQCISGESEGRFTVSTFERINDDLDERYYCYDDSFYVISSIIKTMTWNFVVMVYELSDAEFVQRLSDYIQKSHIDMKTEYYDVTYMSRSQVYGIVHMLHSQVAMRVILILNNTTNKLLRVVNRFDDESNKTTNFRTNSNWIIWTNVGDKHVDLLNLDLKLRRVILLYCMAFYVQSYTLLDNNNTEIIKCLSTRNIQSVDSYYGCHPDTLYPNSKFKLNRRHLVIGTMDSGDFVEVYVDKNNETKYRGSLVNLTAMLSNALNFTYTFIRPFDLKYGVKVNGSWRGLVGQLVRHEVDMVIAELTVTDERLEVIDFILPAFMNQNLGVLYRKDIREESKWVKVFRSLHPDVYVCIFGCIFIISVILCVFDPEYHTRYTNSYVYCNKLASFLISLTDLIGFISLNGNGLWPRKAPMRILVAFFWLFCIVITATYIGNLTAKLTEIIETKPFSSMDELVKLPDWKWGINGGGIMQHMFKKALKGSVLNKFWEGMVKFNKTDTGILVWDVEYHLDRVLHSDDKYAHVVMDGKYYIYSSRHCNLRLIDSVISSLNLAIAVSKNSYLKHDLERTMSTLSNTGLLKPIEDSRYKDNRPRSCKVTKTKRSMRLDDMIGLVPVICFGLGMALIVLIIEMCMKYFRVQHKVD